MTTIAISTMSHSLHSLQIQAVPYNTYEEFDTADSLAYSTFEYRKSDIIKYPFNIFTIRILRALRNL